MQGGFFYEDKRMDKIQECATAFEKLLDTQYHIIIGRKGKSVDLTIEFSSIDFHHLMGLGKLKDLRLSTENRSKVFSRILNGSITDNFLNQSRYISQIQDRFEPLAAIEQILDANSLIFRYNEKQNCFSLIEADFLLSTPHNNNDIYIFIAQKDQAGLYFCRSFFPKSQKDYTIGQPAYTLLFKEKITVSTGEKIIQYDRLTPLQKKPDLTETLDTQPRSEPQKRMSMKERMAAAQAEADRRNSSTTAEQHHGKNHDLEK